MQPARVFSADYDCKRVVETEGGQYLKVETLLVLGPHLPENAAWIARDRIVQDRGQRRAGIFDVGVDAARQHGLLADEASGKVEPAFDAQVGPRLNLLGEDFPEQRLFRKIFGADDDGISADSAACGEPRGQQQDERNE